MKKALLVLMILFASRSGAIVPKELMETSEEGRMVWGLGIQFLVPNQLKGFENSQMVFCPRFYFPLRRGHLQIGASYGSDSGEFPKLDHVLIGELGYRLSFETRFLHSFLTVGGQYSQYRASEGLFKNWGPHFATGIILPLAPDFRMGAELRMLQLEKTVLGFGGNFTFSI